MFAMTISPISNMEEYWREEDDGLSPAHSFCFKTGLSNRRIKFIRQHLATGVAPRYSHQNGNRYNVQLQGRDSLW